MFDIALIFENCRARATRLHSSASRQSEMRNTAAVVGMVIALVAATPAWAGPGATRGASQGQLEPTAHETSHRFVQAKTIKLGSDPRVDAALDCIASFGPQSGVMFMIHAEMRVSGGDSVPYTKQFCTYNGKKQLTLPDIYEYVQQHACGPRAYSGDKEMCKGMPPATTKKEQNSYERTLGSWAPDGVRRTLEIASGSRWGTRYTCGEKKAAAVAFATAVGQIEDRLPPGRGSSGRVTVEFSTLAVSAQSNNVAHCFDVQTHNDRMQCLAKVASVQSVMPCGPGAADSAEHCCQNFAQDLAQPFAEEMARLAGEDGDRVTVSVSMVNDPDAASEFTATKETEAESSSASSGIDTQ